MSDFWQELERLGPRHLVVIAPHPDDEIFAAGGTMRVAQDRGLEVSVLAVTNGEASHARSTVVSPDQISAMRLEEIGEAYAALGLRVHRRCLGMPDGGVNAPDLLKVLREIMPTDSVLVAPLPNDGHPDHDACGLSARSIATERESPLFHYAIWAYHRASAVPTGSWRTWRVDLESETLAAKRLAIDCFRSQFNALGPRPEDGPVLTSGFATPFTQPFEVFYS